MDEPRGSGTRRVLWWWVALPVASVGIAAFVPPAFFAIRYGRKSGYVWSVLLLAALVGFFLTYRDGNHHDVRDGIATGLATLQFVGGAAITAGFVLTTHSKDAVANARALRKQRERARALIAKDPQLAVEAGIGRPDLPGVHDDGGLVDVNRVPAESLNTLPGLGLSLAQRIVETRQKVGGYASLDDLIDTLDLNPRDLDDARDRMAFIPL